MGPKTKEEYENSGQAYEADIRSLYGEEEKSEDKEEEEEKSEEDE